MMPSHHKCLSYLWMHQCFPVMNYPPCCHSNSYNLALHGATHGVVPHSLPHVLHHTCVGTTSDDPCTCVQRGLSVGLFLGLEQSFSESFTSPQGYQETRRDIQDARITSFYCFYS